MTRKRAPGRFWMAFIVPNVNEKCRGYAYDTQEDADCVWRGYPQIRIEGPYVLDPAGKRKRG